MQLTEAKRAAMERREAKRQARFARANPLLAMLDTADLEECRSEPKAKQKPPTPVESDPADEPLTITAIAFLDDSTPSDLALTKRANADEIEDDEAVDAA